MLNEVWTSLLNERHPVGVDRAPWEWVTPDEFEPVELPSYLYFVQQALLGTTGIVNADPRAKHRIWWEKTYTANMLLSMYYSDRFEKYNTYPDIRHTGPDSAPIVFDFSNTLESLNAAAENSSPGLVTLNKAYISPKLYRNWIITHIAGNDFEVVTENSRKTVEMDTVIKLDEDLGFTVDLVTVTAGAEWSITSYIQPQFVLNKVMTRLSKLPGNTLDTLFTVSQPGEENIDTFRRWWQEDQFFDDRLMGCLLAYLYKYQALK